MRKVLLVSLALVLFLSVESYGQRAIKGMRAWQFTAGMVDGIYSGSASSKSGLYAGTSLSIYSNNSNKWVFGGEYLQRNYPYRDIGIPIAQFTAEGGRYFNLWSSGSKVFFLSVGASALAGYESVNWGKSLLYDGASLEHKDKFIYGGALTVEFESYLCDKVVLLLNYRQRALWGTTTGHFHSQFGLGVKFVID